MDHKLIPIQWPLPALFEQAGFLPGLSADEKMIPFHFVRRQADISPAECAYLQEELFHQLTQAPHRSRRQAHGIVKPLAPLIAKVDFGEELARKLAPQIGELVATPLIGSRPYQHF